MSLFGSLLDDMDDDPFFRTHMRQMNNMMSSMNSLFNHSIGGMLGSGGSIGNELMPFSGRFMGGGGSLMPFGFPNMRGFADINQFSNGSNCHSYSSSTVMTMTNGPDGRPQVYQASQSVRSGPGGIKETKKAVADSRSGVKKMSIGHHIGERAHIIEREQNVHSGDQEERQDFINLDEDEAHTFNQEWERKARNTAIHNSIGYSSSGGRYTSRRSRDQLALPAPNNSGRVRSRPGRRSYVPAITASPRYGRKY